MSTPRGILHLHDHTYYLNFVPTLNSWSLKLYQFCQWSWSKSRHISARHLIDTVFLHLDVHFHSVSFFISSMSAFAHLSPNILVCRLSIINRLIRIFIWISVFLVTVGIFGTNVLWHMCLYVHFQLANYVMLHVLPTYNAVDIPTMVDFVISSVNDSYIFT